MELPNGTILPNATHIKVTSKRSVWFQTPNNVCIEVKMNDMGELSITCPKGQVFVLCDNNCIIATNRVMPSDNGIKEISQLAKVTEFHKLANEQFG